MRPEEVAAVLAPTGGAHPGLGRVRWLLERLGCPEPAFPTIAVGGTNGRGAVLALLESVLSAAGIGVGTFSPCDPAGPVAGVRVGGSAVGKERLWALVAEAILPLDELVSGPGRPTLPEAVAAAAFAHFAREGVELALVEAPQGGRHDPAVSLSQPLLSLVAPVEEDSRGRFGPGVGQAAWEEADLARPGVPFLTTEGKGEVLAAFAHRCREVGAALVLVDSTEMEPLELTWERAVWRSRSDPLGLGVFESGLLGAHQGPSLALALGGLAELVGGIPLARDAVREGLASARCPAWFEVISTRPYLVLAGTQNPAGARALLSSLDRLPHPRGRRRLMFGAQRGRLVRDMAEILFPWFGEVAFVSSGSPDEVPAQALLPQARRLGVPGRVIGEPREVLTDLAEEDLLVVYGPPAVAREVRGVLAKLA